MIPVSPLSFNQLSRSSWGEFDAIVAAQLAPLADAECYTVKFYKAPADNQESMAAYGYATYGLQITPGSLIFGFYLPAVHTNDGTTPGPPEFTVQITDVSLQRKFWDDPVSSVFISNYLPEYQTEANQGNLGVSRDQSSFPNLLCTPYPVTGSGQFDVEIQETSGVAQRIELVFGVLEVCQK